MKKILLFLAYALCLSAKLSAQVIDTKALSLEAVKKIATEARKYAIAQQAPGGSVAIVDAGGSLLYLERWDNTFAASAMVAYEKAHTAALFRFPTRKFEEAIKQGRTPLVTVGYNFLEGGVPILYEGQVVGAIGVSGSASAQQDVEIAEAGLKASFDVPTVTE